jgi:hypothetical protein
VNNILGITIEDFDTYHADAADEDDCNDDKEGLVGLFESVDDNPNNEFNIDESSDQSQLFDLSASRVSPISNSTLRDVFGHIVSFYDKSQSDVKYLIGGMAIKMKEIVCEGVKAANSMNIEPKQLAMTNITNLMKDVVQRYQQVFSNRADAFSNRIGPNTTVNKLLPALCATTHKQRFKRHSEHVALSQRSSKMSCGHGITPLLPQATFGMIDEDNGVNLNAKKWETSVDFVNNVRITPFLTAQTVIN